MPALGYVEGDEIVCRYHGLRYDRSGRCTCIPSHPRSRHALSFSSCQGLRLTRSELLTRQGYSPDIRFRLVLGIDAVGRVEEADVGGFQSGHAAASLGPWPIC